MNFHEFEIVDAQSRREFEKLLSFQINGPSVRVPRYTYEKHAGAIQAIQMMAAFRMRPQTVADPHANP